MAQQLLMNPSTLHMPQTNMYKIYILGIKTENIKINHVKELVPLVFVPRRNSTFL